MSLEDRKNIPTAAELERRERVSNIIRKEIAVRETNYKMLWKQEKKKRIELEKRLVKLKRK